MDSVAAMDTITKYPRSGHHNHGQSNPHPRKKNKLTSNSQSNRQHRHCRRRSLQRRPQQRRRTTQPSRIPSPPFRSTIRTDKQSRNARTRSYRGDDGLLAGGQVGNSGRVYASEGEQEGGHGETDGDDGGIVAKADVCDVEG